MITFLTIIDHISLDDVKSFANTSFSSRTRSIGIWAPGHVTSHDFPDGFVQEAFATLLAGKLRNNTLTSVPLDAALVGKRLLARAAAEGLDLVVAVFV